MAVLRWSLLTAPPVILGGAFCAVMAVSYYLEMMNKSKKMDKELDKSK